MNPSIIVTGMLLLVGLVAASVEGREPCQDKGIQQDCARCCIEHGYTNLDRSFMSQTNQCKCAEGYSPCRDFGHSKQKCETCCAGDSKKVVDVPLFEDYAKCRCVRAGLQGVCSHMSVEAKCNECCRRNGFEALPRSLSKDKCVCLTQVLKSTISDRVEAIINEWQ